MEKKMKKKKKPQFVIPNLIKPEKKNLFGTFSVEDYQKTLIIPKDNVRFNPYVDYLNVQRTSKEIEETKVKTEHILAVQVERLKTHWKLLEFRELAFQRTVLAHNKFLKRNLEKRERALIKINNEMELVTKRDREIRLLDQRYDASNAVLIKMKNEIRKHSIYESFLNSVLEHPDSPTKNLFELLSLYESLQSVQERCTNRQSLEMTTTVGVHDENVAYFGRQNYTLVGLKNEMTVLLRRYDETVGKTGVLENIITEIKNKCSEIYYEINLVCHVIDIIYRYICRRRNQKPKTFKHDDTEHKIQVLKETLSSWLEVIKKMEVKPEVKPSFQKE